MRIVNMDHPETAHWNAPRTLIIYTTQKIPLERIQSLRTQFPELDILGISSYHGVFSPSGFQRGSFGFLVEAEDALDIQTLAIDLSHTNDTRQTVKHALAHSKFAQHAPQHVIMHATQGDEERILDGIHDVFSNDVDIFGGTAASDRFLPKAFVFHNDSYLEHGVVLCLLYGDRFHCLIAPGGYLPTQNVGIVTSAEGRTIHAIDHRPAAQVYHEWTNGMFDLTNGGVLPRSAALYPFARPMSNTDDRMWLAHPARICPQNQSIALYSEYPQGAAIIQTRGSAESLIAQAGIIFSRLLNVLPRNDVKAGVFMYCAGCASVVAENMNDVCEQLKTTMGDIPFIGCATCGEQGRFPGFSDDAHGNMMIVAILIRKHRENISHA